MKDNISDSRNRKVYNLVLLAAVNQKITANREYLYSENIDDSCGYSNNPIYQDQSSTRRITRNEEYSLDRLKVNKRLLDNYKNLKSNWNGYRGEPINNVIIKKVESLIINLEFQPKLFPTGRGTIQMEYYLDDKSLIEIEVFEDEFFLYKEENGSEYEVSIKDNQTLQEMIFNFYAR